VVLKGVSAGRRRKRRRDRYAVSNEQLLEFCGTIELCSMNSFDSQQVFIYPITPASLHNIVVALANNSPLRFLAPCRRLKTLSTAASAGLAEGSACSAATLETLVHRRVSSNAWSSTRNRSCALAYHVVTVIKSYQSCATIAHPHPPLQLARRIFLLPSAKARRLMEPRWPSG
jgi:hypothetical protein